MLREVQPYVYTKNSYTDGLAYEYANFLDLTSKAKKLDINTYNNSNLKKLVNDWTKGIYDEDPDILMYELLKIVR